MWSSNGDFIQRLGRYSVLGVCCVLMLMSASQAQDVTTDSPIELKLVDALFSNRNGLADVNGRLDLTVELINNSDQQQAVDLRQLVVICDDQEYEVRATGSPSSLFVKKAFDLKAQQTVKGELTIRLSSNNSGEPELRLKSKDENWKLNFNLNQAFRRRANFKVTRCGPQEQLAIVETSLNVCPILTWVLDEKLRDWQSQNIRRIVLVSSGKRDRNSAYSTDSVQAWLQSLTAANKKQDAPLPGTHQPSAKFDRFLIVVAKGPYVRSRSSPTWSGGSQQLFCRTRTEAVVAALYDVYENVSMNVVMADLQHAEEGLRKLAISQHIDRMTAQQLDRLIDSIEDMDPVTTKLLAENLHRIALSQGIDGLKKLVKHQTPEVALAALSSLIKSSSPHAAACVRTLWQNPQAPITRLKIADEVLASSGLAHAELLEEYAISLLQQFSSDEPTDTSAQTMLTKLLKHLQDQHREDIIPTAEKLVLQIKDFKAQDVVMNFLVNRSEGNGSLPLIRSYVRQRMDKIQAVVTKSMSNSKPGEPAWKRAADLGRSQGSKLGITLLYLTQIRQVPTPQYTQTLGFIAASQMSSTVRRMAWSAAIVCANRDQLTELVQSFSQIDNNSKMLLLKALAEVEHPEFLPLLSKCLDSSETDNIRPAIDFLNRNPQDSPDVLLLLIEKSNALLKDLETAANTDHPPTRLTARQRAIFVPMIQRLSEFSHPEAHRVLNRCERSAVLEVHEILHTARRRYLGMLLLHRDAIQKANDFRRTEQYLKARDVYDDILKINPLCAMVYASRSSVYLRLGEPEKAKADIRRCLELDPENATNQSLAALAEIQLGNVQQGLQELKRVNESLPDIATSVKTNALYNLACGYSRALEKETSADVIARYTKQGMDALRRSVDRDKGFMDPEHLDIDPDLKAFRKHADWPEIRLRAEENLRSSQ